MEPTDLPKLHPTADRLVVWMDPGVQETPSGLIIPPQAQQITQTGLVLAVGPDVKNVVLSDRVLVGLHAGTHLTWKQNTPVLLVHESELIAVLSGEPSEVSV